MLLDIFRGYWKRPVAWNRLTVLTSDCVEFSGAFSPLNYLFRTLSNICDWAFFVKIVRCLAVNYFCKKFCHRCFKGPNRNVSSFLKHFFTFEGKPAIGRTKKTYTHYIFVIWKLIVYFGGSSIPPLKTYAPILRQPPILKNNFFPHLIIVLIIS